MNHDIQVESQIIQPVIVDQTIGLSDDIVTGQGLSMAPIMDEKSRIKDSKEVSQVVEKKQKNETTEII